jgi:phosphoribosylformylglycinamidine synthase I
MKQPNVLILHATGANRDLDAAQAVELAGGKPEVVHINQLRNGERRWQDYQMLVLPGGFSYADALGAGKLLALDLSIYFADQIKDFVSAGKAVIGICNGFQTLVKAGILPHPTDMASPHSATLTFNDSGRFECRWVTLRPVSQKCIWTHGLSETITCPVAHGEGKFAVVDNLVLQRLAANDQIALTYSRPDGSKAYSAYPANPNGSVADIAGICNPSGTVLGLMPHPENHIFGYQNPDKKNPMVSSGLPLFTNGIAYASQL